jgi:CHAT domain-containing protein
LQGAEASLNRLSEIGLQPSLMYLSCHGRFDRSLPVNSHLLMSDGSVLPSRIQAPVGTELLSVRQVIERMSPYAPVMILDACFSGVQNLAPGDEPLGFPAAFLISGSQAVIASNWIVEQNRAREFMLALTTSWVEDRVPLGEAMRRAYDLVRRTNPHPFHWAAFSLHGDQSVLWEDLLARTAN